MAEIGWRAEVIGIMKTINIKIFRERESNVICCCIYLFIESSIIIQTHGSLLSKNK